MKGAVRRVPAIICRGTRGEKDNPARQAVPEPDPNFEMPVLDALDIDCDIKGDYRQSRYSPSFVTLLLEKHERIADDVKIRSGRACFGF